MEEINKQEFFLQMGLYIFQNMIFKFWLFSGFLSHS